MSQSEQGLAALGAYLESSTPLVVAYRIDDAQWVVSQVIGGSDGDYEIETKHVRSRRSAFTTAANLADFHDLDVLILEGVGDPFDLMDDYYTDDTSEDDFDYERLVDIV